MSLEDSQRKKFYSDLKKHKGYTKKEYYGGASEKMKSEVTTAAKKKRDRLQARHVSPGGGAKFKYGPHKVDVNRRDTEALFGKGNLQEKFIAFANKFDAKQDKKREAKQTKKKMQKRAKKLTAYESYT